MLNVGNGGEDLVDTGVIATLRNCSGYYDAGAAGPLVTYAGKYVPPVGSSLDPGKSKHYVGQVYYNFAMAEPWPAVREYFAAGVAVELEKLGIAPDLIIGAPMGGIMMSTTIGHLIACPSIFFEKNVTVAAALDQGIKEESDLVVERHDLQMEVGMSVLVGEDVVNNLSTPEKAFPIIRDAGCELVGIICVINRSGREFWEHGDVRVPIIAMEHIPTQQWQQEDPAVRRRIAAGEVFIRPKRQWSQVLHAAEKIADRA